MAPWEEGKARWGNDVEAISRLTSSFYVKIAEKLREKKLCAVPIINQLFVLQSGIVFKIVVVHDRILTLLEEVVETLNDSGAARIESSLQGIRLTAWKKNFIAEPFLQRTLQSFSTSYKFFGSTVQLVKKWIGWRLLSGHFNDYIIELLVVAAIKKTGTVEPHHNVGNYDAVIELDPSAVVRKTPILERRPAKFQKSSWIRSMNSSTTTSFIR
ncbi:unnamed protein product [Caenorhabditis sp. 36 PRJEB53466]|nr:unnamed protein product [Caenorhabditis sp. 36 PRJEB53466]